MVAFLAGVALFAPVVAMWFSFSELVRGFGELSETTDVAPVRLAENIVGFEKAAMLSVALALFACFPTWLYVRSNGGVDRWFLWVAGVATAGWALIAAFWFYMMAPLMGVAFVVPLVGIWLILMRSKARIVA